MQHKNLLKKTMLFVLATSLTASVMAQLPKVIVKGNITQNTTWNSNHIYLLSDIIYVTNNATLTIEPGTVIYGNDATHTKKGSLVITKGAKLMAVGTPCQPIVFTSGLTPSKRARGDWGGVILLGKAHTNSPGDTNHIEGIPPTHFTLYGGGAHPIDNDNSGSLEYVRIEYAGVALSPNNEINGLTFGAVGSGTTIDHVQVSYSNDDSYEWFGGKVNCKHLIAFRGIDDDFDTDQGYSGMVQFGIALRDPKVADVSKSHSFESDNDANGSSNLPQTKAIFCNITSSAGGDVTQNALFEAGVYIRRNSALKVYNSIVMGWTTYGIYIDGTSSQANVLSDTLVNDNIIGVQNPNNYVATVSPSGATSVIDLLQNHAGNRFYTGNAGIKLNKPYYLNGPIFRPNSSSPAKTGANFNHAGLNNPFFTKTTYVGAISPIQSQDWTLEGWVNWRPDTTNYSHGVPDNCSGKAIIADDDAVAQNDAVADVKVSPNPNAGIFNIALSGFATNVVNVKVSDLNTGRVYFVGKANNNTTTNISLHAPNGNYVVELTDGKTVLTRKVSVLN